MYRTYSILYGCLYNVGVVDYMLYSRLYVLCTYTFPCRGLFLYLSAHQSQVGSKRNRKLVVETARDDGDLTITLHCIVLRGGRPSNTFTKKSSQHRAVLPNRIIFLMNPFLNKDFGAELPHSPINIVKRTLPIDL
jgi:hypothetical protein